MMRYIFIFLCSIIYSGVASQPLPDSVKTLYNAAKTDAEKGKCLYPYLISIKEDSNYFNTLLELSSYFKNKNDQPGQDYVQLSASSKLAETGDFATALIESHQLLSNFEKRHDDYGKINAYSWIGFALDESGDFEQAISYYKKVVYAASPTGDKQMLSRANNDLSAAYAQLNMGDSGLAYAQQSVTIDYEINDSKHLCYSLATVGENYIAKKEYDLATPFIKKAYLLSLTFNDSWPIAWSLNDLAQIFLETNRHDSARRYAQMAVELANEKGFIRQSLRAYEYLYRSFEKTDTKDSVYKYFRLAISTKDSLYTAKKAKDIQAMNFREQLRQQEIEQEKMQLQNKIRTYSMLAGLVVFSIIAFILYRNNRGKQKANKVLQSSLNNLRSTQSQLIQSEKMASLGELTAGIAHEIQNPLNFVNNFSEVNTELIAEMKEEIEKGNIEEVKVIVNDIADNEKKINHHGKRADAIVKGMLQHSQASTGKKEPTDINKLADEYLRLSYHGVLAKDKSFNATLQTDFDENIGNINIIPQDIGRVLLNLYNNAFYAVNEKQKAESLPTGQAGLKPKDQGNNYEPTVIVSTKKVGDKIEIKVSDNGNGIPQKIVDKIFQPFFTTKPTGQGTGLGLSLAYDIIKAHGGEIKVESKEGEGSEFLILLTNIKLTT